MTRRFDSWYASLALVGLVVVIVAVLTDAGARAGLDESFSFSRPQHLSLYVSSAAVVLVGALVAAVVGRGRVGAVLVTVVVISVVGTGIAFDENGLNSFPTTRPSGRTLAERAANDRNGDLSLTWPAFVELRQVVNGVVIVPAETAWRAYLEQVSELRVQVDPDYDFRLDRDDPRFHGEWLLDRGLRTDFRLVVVGRGVD